MTNNQSSIIDNQFKQFAQIAGSAQIAVFFQNRASSIKHRASSMQNKPNTNPIQTQILILDVSSPCCPVGGQIYPRMSHSWTQLKKG
jgi:hypothetical protein